MKILFISDIHGITTNLDKIKDIYNKGNFDKMVVLGDLYYAGFNGNSYLDYYDNEVVRDFLAEYSDNIICMRGNCDSDIDIKVSDFPINEGISLINVDGVDIFLTHGNKYNPDNFSRNGVLIYGHYHVPKIKQDSNMIYVCVGSVSLPRSGTRASYGVYEDRKITLYTIEGEVIDSISL